MARCDEMWRDEYIKLSKEDYRNSHAVETSFPRQSELLGASFHAFLGRRLDTETDGLQNVDCVAIPDKRL